MKIAKNLDFPHLSLHINGETRTSVEHCSRCGESKAFTTEQTLFNAICAGSAFGFQHSLPNCGKNGLKDLMQKDSEE